METSPLLSATDHAQNAPNGKAASTLADVRTLQEVLARFKSVQVDPAEFACLKAIALFKPGKLTDLIGEQLSYIYHIWFHLVDILKYFSIIVIFLFPQS